MPKLTHYTLNTGDSRESPRSEVEDHVLRIMRPLLAEGKHDLPMEGYRLLVTLAPAAGGLFATIFCGRRPCVTVVVAGDDPAATEIWPWVEKHYHSLTDLPGLRSADFAAAKQPAQTPWCAAITIFATPEEASWLGDFERCLAWAWLEREQQ